MIPKLYKTEWIGVIVTIWIMWTNNYLCNMFSFHKLSPNFSLHRKEQEILLHLYDRYFLTIHVFFEYMHSHP